VRHERHADPLEHMNHDHADDLLVVARALAGYPEATGARAERVDRYGLDLRVEAPDGPTAVRVEFAEPIPEGDHPDGVRVAFVRLVRRARSSIAL
jgi:putative heme iron utilization protein